VWSNPSNAECQAADIYRYLNIDESKMLRDAGQARRVTGRRSALMQALV